MKAIRSHYDFRIPEAGPST